MLATAILHVALAAGTDETRLVMPLRFGFGVVAQHARTALEMDEEGRVTIERNTCNRMRVSDLRVIADPPDAWVSVAVDADLGTRIFGRCVGPSNAQGRLRVRMSPAIADGGRGVILELQSAELRRPDGSQGLLTRPARVLAEKLILPRMEDIAIDLSEPLADLDGLIESLVDLPEEAARLLAAPTNLVSVATTDNALTVEIVAQLNAPADPVPAEPPLSDSELERWDRIEDELDGFLTTTIMALAVSADSRDLQLDLLAILLDARLAIAAALGTNADSTSEPDPVRELFINSWDQLRPSVEALALGAGHGEIPGIALTTFMAGADAIRGLDALGPAFGFEVSRNGIRRLARMLLADEAPASFTPLPLGIDGRFRDLFGIEPPISEASSAPDATTFYRMLDWILPAALANNDEQAVLLALRVLLPSAEGIDEYLRLTADLLQLVVDRHLATDARLPEEVQPMFGPMVLATAWKESCWRHYLSQDEPPAVIRSAIGAVGIMQINGRVWRGIYELDRLEYEVDYNIAAGVDILEHYLVDYALRRGEQAQPGGLQNLPRATYSAYNGGPGQLSRYRQETTSARLKSIDDAFWEHYVAVRDKGSPDIASCYPW